MVVMTEADRRRYEAYEAGTKKQLQDDAEYEKRPLRKISFDLLFDELEKVNLEYITELSKDIGVLSKALQTFKNNAKTKQALAIAKLDMEEASDEIRERRETRNSIG